MPSVVYTIKRPKHEHRGENIFAQRNVKGLNIDLQIVAVGRNFWDALADPFSHKTTEVTGQM